MPIRMHVHVDARHAGVNDDILLEGGVLELVADADDGALGPALDHLHGFGLLQVPLFFIEPDLPGVLLRGTIVERLQQTAAAARGDRFLAIGLVDQAGDAAGLGIDLHAEEFVLDRSCRSTLSGVVCARAVGNGDDVDRLVAQRRNVLRPSLRV